MGDATIDRHYLRDAWYMVGWSRDLDAHALNKTMILGEPLIVYRLEEGDWTALEDVCCHRLVPLSLGRREGGAVRCMYHGLKFAADGRCIEIPGQDQISSGVRVRAYPVQEKRGALWVWMGEAGRADIALIPSVADVGDADFVFTCGSVDVAGDARLIWDNLLDLTHVPFAHAATFGGGDPEAISTMIAAEAEKLQIETTDRGVATWRWHLNKPGYQFLGGSLSDEFITGDFVAPGALLIRTEIYPVGTGRHGERPPAHAVPLSVRVACQVVVPEGEGRARIHYHAGVHQDAAEAIDGMARLLGAVLQEDKAFIEAQYAKMEQLPLRRPMDLAMDRSGVKFRAVMRKLRNREGALH